MKKIAIVSIFFIGCVVFLSDQTFAQTTPLPTNITPTLFCLGSCPTVKPVVKHATPEKTTRGNTSATTPNTVASVTPDTFATEPCTNQEISTLHTSEKKQTHGGSDGFFKALIEFILRLIELIMQKSGLLPPSTSPVNPDNPANPTTPCSEPTGTVSISITPANAPTTANVAPLPTSATASTKKLLLHEQSPPSASQVKANAAKLGTLPFHGLVFSIASSSKVFSSSSVSLGSIQSELAPLKGANLGNLKNNWVIVYANPAGNATAWNANVANNFANLAQAANEAGLAGIYFDSEEYSGNVWNNSGTPEQMRNAGKAVMQAMVAKWPNVKFLSLYGPEESEPLTADALNPPTYPDVSFANPDYGHFAVGMIQGTFNTNATYIDGGETYTQNSLADLEKLKNWLKVGLPEKSSLVPDADRAQYKAKITWAVGVYDFPGNYRGKTSNPTTWQNDLTQGLAATDEYVWVYSERFDWTDNNSGKQAVDAAWLTATQNAYKK